MTDFNPMKLAEATFDVVSDMVGSPLERTGVHMFATGVSEMMNATAGVKDSVFHDVFKQMADAKTGSTVQSLMDITAATGSVKKEGFDLKVTVNKAAAVTAAVGGAVTLTGQFWKDMPDMIKNTGWWMSKGGVATIFINKVVSDITAKSV
jgi:hypothetical protein